MSRSNDNVPSQESTVPQADPMLALRTLTIPAAVCQLNSNTASVALNATLGESLTVAATPSTVAIPLVSGATAAGTSPVAITTTWVLSATRTAVTLVGYFSSATVALTNRATTPANIPAAEVLGQMTTGTPTSFTAFTQTAPLGTAGAGLTLFTQRSSIDQGTASLAVAGVGLLASFYHSNYLGNWNNSTAYTAGRDFTKRIHAMASYLESRPNNAAKTRSFIANFSEVLTPRWNVTEVITRSHGQSTIAFGGGFLSNLVSVSADYETYYVPQRNSSPFVQAMIVDLQIHLFRGVTLHGGSFVAPDGSLRYTADATGIMTRETTGGGGGAALFHR